MKKSRDWEISEKIVTIVERQVGPGAVIRRDVNLPVIGSKSGRTRQCDIVIEEGSDPRKTVSIVEVQKRKSKPNINDFNGWIEKLKEVGAQHLICVSAKGFPSSIEEKATQIGPTVRLATLKNVDDIDWSFLKKLFQNRLQIVRYDKLNGMQLEGEHLFRLDPDDPNPATPPDPHRKYFRFSDGRQVSPTDLVDWHLFSIPKNLEELPENVEFTLGVKFSWEYNQGLQYQDFGGRWVFLKSLFLTINLFIRSEEITWEAQSYEQTNWGIMAWALRGNAIVSGKTFDIVAPIIHVAPGEYKLRTPVVLGDYNAFVAVGDKGYKAERFSD